MPALQTSFVSGQSLPHALQFAASVCVFTQAVGVSVGHSTGKDAGQVQAPPEQISFVSVQAFPHEPASGPQFRRSVSVSVQDVPQSSSSGGKHPQVPASQPSPGLAQGVLQAPQAPGSVWRSRQRGTSASQRVVPAVHWQTPPEHVPSPQAIPQAPQWFASVAVSTHIPPHRSWPEGHSSSSDVQPERHPESTRARPAMQRIPGVGRAMCESYVRRAPGPDLREGAAGDR